MCAPNCLKIVCVEGVAYPVSGTPCRADSIEGNDQHRTNYEIFADGKNKIGRDVIVFVKLIDGVGYRHVEELRGKHKLVATDSLRKKKGAWGA